MEKASEKQAAKKKNSKIKLILAVMITAALFLAELYFMITAPSSIAFIIGIGVGMLVTAAFAVSAAVDCVGEKTEIYKELYDNIHKSEKASYLLLKKRLEALSKQVQTLEKSSNKKDNSSAEIIQAQKAIAKTAIGRSKQTQERLFVELNNLEASLNDSVHDLSKRLSGFQEEIERLADHIAKINTEAIQEAVHVVQKYSDEPEINLNEFEAPEFEEHEPDLEIELEEEASVDDILGSIGFDFEEEPQLESVSEPEPIPEPTPIPAAAPADDGGKMNQDDIAALIASMTGGDVEPEPEPEPAPLPVDDNPNRMMTPEEIEALLASM